VIDDSYLRPPAKLFLLIEQLKQKRLRQLWIANEAYVSH
jgi:hypothetical protein